MLLKESKYLSRLEGSSYDVAKTHHKPGRTSTCAQEKYNFLAVRLPVFTESCADKLEDLLR